MTDRDTSPGADTRALAPEREAALMLELLDALEKSDSREARRLRSSLLSVVEDFRARRDRGDALESVRDHTRRGLAELEMRAAATIARATWKLHDRALARGRRLGPTSPHRQSLRALASSLGLYAEALEQLVDAGRLGDAALRDRALALVLQARDLLFRREGA